jgi:hypothetical protein
MHTHSWRGKKGIGRAKLRGKKLFSYKKEAEKGKTLRNGRTATRTLEKIFSFYVIFKAAQSLQT